MWSFFVLAMAPYMVLRSTPGEHKCRTGEHRWCTGEHCYGDSYLFLTIHSATKYHITEACHVREVSVLPDKICTTHAACHLGAIRRGGSQGTEGQCEATNQQGFEEKQKQLQRVVMYDVLGVVSVNVVCSALQSNYHHLE
jgi:hypothetical protein